MTDLSANPKHGYDSACETLAEHFLHGDPVNHLDAKVSLSSAIQAAVESWFEHERAQFEAAPESIATLSEPARS